jgi:hypothetical protein
MAPASWRPAEPKVILNNVSGGINPGHFVSIIGASGKHYNSLNYNNNINQFNLFQAYFKLYIYRCW